MHEAGYAQVCARDVTRELSDASGTLGKEILVTGLRHQYVGGREIELLSMSVFGKLRLPIGLAPMAGVTTADMAAKACMSGILGSLGVGMMEPESIRRAVAEIREKAPGRPFHLNLFKVDESPQFDPSDAKSALEWVSHFCKNENLPAPEPSTAIKPPFAPSFAAQFAEVLDLKPTIVSFTFGLVSSEQIQQCHAAGIEVWGTATSAHEAALWRKLGVDAVVLQGAEAGGHRGSLTTESEPSAVPLEKLLRETLAESEFPYVVSGGVMSGSQVSQLLRKGAVGVQLGTIFLGASDSAANACLRAALYGALGSETQLTKSFTGRWARGILNDFMKEGSDKFTLPYPVMNKLTQPLRAAALKQQDAGALSLWAGTGFRQCRDIPLAQLVDELEREYRKDND